MSINVKGAYYSIFAPRFESRKDFVVAMEMKNLTSSLGAFVGSNSYGVKRRVSKYNQDIYSIVFGNCKKQSKDSYDRESSLETYGFDTEIDVDTLDAIDLKYNVALLFVGKLKLPYSEENAGLIAKATVSNPTEITGTYRNIFFDVNSIWIYSKNTGKVYTKINKCSAGDSKDYRNWYNFFF